MKNTFLGILIVLAILSIGVLNASAEQSNTLVSVTADYWMPAIDANIKSTELTIIGTDIDIIDDLGLDDSENIPALKGSIDLPLFPEILVSYFNIDGSASKNITKNLVYKGVTYSATNNVSSSYDITQFEGLLAFSPINMEAAKLGFLIGVKYFEVETTLKDNTLGTNKSESVDGPVPVIGVIGGVKLPGKFRVEGIARGLTIELDDVEASLYDIEAGVHYDFNKFFRASVGYRYFLIDAEDNSTNDSVDIKFAGPYIGVTGSF